jgi:hypothetical protein
VDSNIREQDTSGAWHIVDPARVFALNVLRVTLSGDRMLRSVHIYEVRPRKDHDQLSRFAVVVAQFRALRPFTSAIRVYDEAGNVIETHEHIGEFKEW